MAPEIYQPLNPAKKQVRIFRLAPGDFGRPIKGSLIIISLDKLRRRKWQKLRKWNALSYVWGTSPRDQILKTSRRSILITETLHCALQYLRHSHDARYFWIDQICINQDDIEERGSQVPLMRHIYSSATYVIAWFGAGLAEIEHLFGMTMFAGALSSKFGQELFEEKFQTFCNNARWELMERILFLGFQLRDSDVTLEQFYNTLFEHLRVLFDQPWFKRIWTLQEALLARKLVFKAGRMFTRWIYVLQILDRLASAPLTPRGPRLKDLAGLDEGWYALFLLRRGTCPICHFYGDLSWIRLTPHVGRKASDDRDYVYGQLGLVNAKTMDFLKPDYSAEVESVFIDYTMAILKAHTNLKVLETCCAASGDPKYNLPSWCRDWSGSFSGWPYIQTHKDDLYNAATLRGPHTGYRILRDVLCVRGVIIDEISIRYSGSMADDDLDVLRAWHMICQAFLPSDGCSNEEERQKALCRTLINDTFDGVNRPSSVAISQVVAWLRELSIEINDADQYTPDVITDGLPVGYMIFQIKHIAKGHRSLFETKQHRFGQSCRHILPGDRICLLYGGQLPFTLREARKVVLRGSNDQSIENQAYQLFGGGCYVDGLMDNQVFEIAEREGLPVQDIYLV